MFPTGVCAKAHQCAYGHVVSVTKPRCFHRTTSSFTNKGPTVNCLLRRLCATSTSPCFLSWSLIHDSTASGLFVQNLVPYTIYCDIRHRKKCDVWWRTGRCSFTRTWIPAVLVSSWQQIERHQAEDHHTHTLLGVPREQVAYLRKRSPLLDRARRLGPYTWPRWCCCGTD